MRPRDFLGREALNLLQLSTSIPRLKTEGSSYIFSCVWNFPCNKTGTFVKHNIYKNCKPRLKFAEQSNNISLIGITYKDFFPL